MYVCMYLLSPLRCSVLWPFTLFSSVAASVVQFCGPSRCSVLWPLTWFTFVCSHVVQFCGCFSCQLITPPYINISTCMHVHARGLPDLTLSVAINSRAIFFTRVCWYNVQRMEIYQPTHTYKYFVCFKAFAMPPAKSLTSTDIISLDVQ